MDSLCNSRVLASGESRSFVKQAVASGLCVAVSLLLAESPRARAADGSIMAVHVEAARAQDSTANESPKSKAVQYAVPSVTLVREDGKVVSLPQEMNDGRPVLLNFIFTSCGSTCPLMSQVFAQFQHMLGAAAAQVHLMSISVDPEEDTPARLAEYAHKFGAGPGWHHYTGTLEATRSAQQAFDVYRGDKMSHAPVTLLRAAPGQPWRRVDGFATPDDLLREYRQLLAARRL
jgi:protein SCO1